ncbi:MAG TPA: Crp/Fnr family transcriptional regulator [Blastocatellia bacterium]|nr:Crp/Fnr family transcriptional regulator [Blastocatellia bacterium]
MLDLSTHDECAALSSVFQGGLCEKLTARPARTYDRDQIVYSMGDEAHSIYFLRRGLVKLTAISEEGREIILSVNKPGEIFGEFCLCDRKRNEMAMTMEPSEIVEIKFGDLIAHLQNNKDALYNFLVSVCQRLSRAYQIICEFSFDNLPERLAKVLLRLGDEFGRETERGVELEYYITQEELAQMVSARREVVSTALSRLRERGLVEYSRKGKLTINRTGLLAFVEGDHGRQNERIRAAG